MTLTVCAMLWQPNAKSYAFSRDYDETWVEKLYRGFRRHLSGEFRFVCFTDRERLFGEPIETEPLFRLPPDYGSCIEPFRLDDPLIIVGLDTVITGNIDHMAEYCLAGDMIMLPRAPYQPDISCNGVALVPKGNTHVYETWNGEKDMEWLRTFSVKFIDDEWPGHVLSYKGHVKDNGLGDARIVYFHGQPKMHQITEPWVQEFWQ